MANKITTLYEDSAKTTALYPRTKTSAVSDIDGNALGNIAVYSAETIVSGANPIKVDLNIFIDVQNLISETSTTGATTTLDITQPCILVSQSEKTWRAESNGTITLNGVQIAQYGTGGGDFWTRVGSTIILLQAGDTVVIQTSQLTLINKLYGLK